MLAWLGNKEKTTELYTKSPKWKHLYRIVCGRKIPVGSGRKNYNIFIYSYLRMQMLFVIANRIN